jgi:hypothetical protein
VIIFFLTYEGYTQPKINLKIFLYSDKKKHKI